MFDSIKAGKQIATYRKKLNLTQEELAEKLDISPQAISKWENGYAMPEVSILFQLSEVLNCSIDTLLKPKSYNIFAGDFDFEFIVLPRSLVGNYSGPEWPKSIMYGSLMTALKLFLGLESRRDYQNRQTNDEEEYILQSAISNICFGYSWYPDKTIKDSYSIYGLDFEIFIKSDYSEEHYISLARKQIETGYPVIILPDKYSDVIFAIGYSYNGKVLKGLGFLDGDDQRNAKINFNSLNNYEGWYSNSSKMILVKPSMEKISVEHACKNAIHNAISLLSNLQQINRPDNISATIYGYGAIIYDNWCKLLTEENRLNVKNMDSLFPQAFIHYENKLRTKQFFEKCTYIINGVDQSLLASAIKQYDELMNFAGEIAGICHERNEINPDEMNDKRNYIINMLRRSKEIEGLALSYIQKAINNI
jgi:transcriptional regulator with XRE-family HTH domain